MEKLQQQLAQYMDAWAAADRFSGTVLVARGDRLLLHQGYGCANHEFRVKNTATTKLNIGSVTKLFTAAAVMQLVEQGRVQLDGRVSAYLPDFIHGDRVTVHQLLSSSSGIADYTELPSYTTRSKLTADMITGWLNGTDLRFEPGERTEKSNSNFVLLARLVEAAAGMDIESYYAEMIFGPAGLTHTGVSRNEDVIAGKACGYSCSGEGVIRAEYYEMSGAYGSGFLYSNAEDLWKWTKALREGTVISKDTYSRMTEAYGYIPYLGASAGYGWMVKGEPAEEVFMDGNIHGYTCSVHQSVARDETIIILANNDASPISRIFQGLKSILSDQEPCVIIAPELVEQADYESYRELAGKYLFGPMGWAFTVSFEDGALVVDRLFIQEAKRRKFPLKLVSENSGSIVFACAVCDGTFIFQKSGQPRVTYIFDTLKLDYERMS